MGFENLDIELLAEKAGGRIKSASLIQKRIRELERGWPSLLATTERDLIQVALKEFSTDKIWLVSGDEAAELGDQRLVEERERARAVETARRATELEAGPAPSIPRPGLGGVLGLKP